MAKTQPWSRKEQDDPELGVSDPDSVSLSKTLFFTHPKDRAALEAAITTLAPMLVMLIGSFCTDNNNESAQRGRPSLHHGLVVSSSLRGCFGRRIVIGRSNYSIQLIF
jgi:hypothetical protein